MLEKRLNTCSITITILTNIHHSIIVNSKFKETVWEKLASGCEACVNAHNTHIFKTNIMMVVKYIN